MTPREVQELRRRLRNRPVAKPRIPEMEPAPAYAPPSTIWVAPRNDRARRIRQAVTVFTPIAAGAAALVGAAWYGLL